MKEQSQIESKFVDEAAAARLINMSVHWLQKRRWKGGGPPFCKLGSAVRYNVDQLFEWAAMQGKSHS